MMARPTVLSWSEGLKLPGEADHWRSACHVHTDTDVKGATAVISRE